MISFPISQSGLMHPSQTGRVDGILVRPKRKLDPMVVEAWNVLSAEDHGKITGNRAVTLIQKEHLSVASALAGHTIDWRKTRRNLLVSNINLFSLVGHRFRIGNVLLEGKVIVDPCKNMEEAMGTGTYAAMMGHGGIGAKIIEGGTIHIGDTVQWVSPND